MSRIAILHLEASARDAERVRARLSQGGLEFALSRVDSCDAFTAAVASNRYDLILADYALPGFDGLDALEIAKAKQPGIPFLFVSGVHGEEIAVDSLHRGAADYVLKKRLDRLVPAVRRALAESVERRRREQEPAALSGAPVLPHSARKHLKILVVEDNRDAADSLRVLLELFGYEVTVAYTGTDGLAAARRQKPDVVLCDIGLPGMDGFAVANALRKSPETAGTRLIAVTGYGREEDRRRAFAAGFDEHLVKPVDPEKLLVQIDPMPG